MEASSLGVEPFSRTQLQKLVERWSNAWSQTADTLVGRRWAQPPTSEMTWTPNITGTDSAGRHGQIRGISLGRDVLARPI